MVPALVLLIEKTLEGKEYAVRQLGKKCSIKPNATLYQQIIKRRSNAIYRRASNLCVSQKDKIEDHIN
jgi:hypothetical protein